ncbi:HPP family protein [Thermobifida halotolerans]|uniref:HPP family protein n=1 Tax=Thermobifida halotolerans TaxID=483545 RepID=A0AA97LYN0_9ACTN|nr:HPP family protein [Thermobifida halotolerans]UOE20394.1 HPP family protein [Thermobifida halotolerans]
MPDASRSTFAAFDLVVGAVGLAVIGLLAFAFDQPLLFPSLGPTLMLTLDSPNLPSARPVDALVGHYVGIVAGAASLAVTGLPDAPSVLREGVTAPRIAAAALSLGLTAALLRLLRRRHPPAGATTLIISLGLMTTLADLAAIAVSVAILVAICVVIDRLRPERLMPQ